MHARWSRASFERGAGSVRKIILISILFANVVIPIWGSRDRDVRRGLRSTLVVLVLFDLAYLLALRFVYPHL